MSTDHHISTLDEWKKSITCIPSDDVHWQEVRRGIELVTNYPHRAKSHSMYSLSLLYQADHCPVIEQKILLLREARFSINKAIAACSTLKKGLYIAIRAQIFFELGWCDAETATCFLDFMSADTLRTTREKLLQIMSEAFQCRCGCAKENKSSIPPTSTCSSSTCSSSATSSSFESSSNIVSSSTTTPLSTTVSFAPLPAPTDFTPCLQVGQQIRPNSKPYFVAPTRMSHLQKLQLQLDDIHSSLLRHPSSQLYKTKADILMQMFEQTKNKTWKEDALFCKRIASQLEHHNASNVQDTEGPDSTETHDAKAHNSKAQDITNKSLVTKRKKLKQRLYVERDRETHTENGEQTREGR